MTKKNNVVAATHNSTVGGNPVQEILNVDLPPEALRLRVAIVLTSKDLLRNILGLTPQDQTKFLDKADQV